MSSDRRVQTVTHLISGLSRASGGTTAVAIGMCSALAAGGVRTALVHPRSDDDAELPLESVAGVALDPACATVAGFPSAFRAVRAVLRRHGPDLLHVHGLWSPMLVAAAAAARAEDIPYVVQPHGMLEPWSLNQSAWKKRLALAIYQRRMLERAAMIVCCAEAEACAIAALGFRAPRVVVPNGVDAPPVADAEGPRRAGASKRTALFLSRLHRKKGVVDLVRAWLELHPPGWRLVIAGPDEDGEGARAKEIVGTRQDAGIEFLGPVYASAKEALFGDAEIFVLPTYSENFGVAVVEAMMRGIPVITTRETPWVGLDEIGIGWTVPAGEEGVRQALASATAMAPDELRAMGDRAAGFARRFSWTNVTATLLEAYDAVIA